MVAGAVAAVGMRAEVIKMIRIGRGAATMMAFLCTLAGAGAAARGGH